MYKKYYFKKLSKFQKLHKNVNTSLISDLIAWLTYIKICLRTCFKGHNMHWMPNMVLVTGVVVGLFWKGKWWWHIRQTGITMCCGIQSRVLHVYVPCPNNDSWQTPVTSYNKIHDMRQKVPRLRWKNRRSRCS